MQNVFTNINSNKTRKVEVSYSISKIIVKRVNISKMVKKYHESVVNIVFLDKINFIKDIFLSKHIITRRILEISNQKIILLKDRLNNFRYVSMNHSFVTIT